MKNWTIVNHWTGGGYHATSLDLKHYQAVVEASAKVIYGNFTAEDQRSTSDGVYGAHTRAFNTKCIGVAVACMLNGKENAPAPNYGSTSPLGEAQFHEMCRVNASFCAEYDIPVSPTRVLTHAEVQPTLGIRQNGKWDITVLPWDDTIQGHRMVGDYIRELTSKYLLEIYPEKSHLADLGDIATDNPTLKKGSRGAAVKILQSDLHDLRYFSGSIDGDFGKRTRGAVLAFQADNDMVTDGVVGPRTWDVLGKAEARQLRAVTEADLDQSGTIQDTRQSDKLADVVALGGVGTTIADAQGKIAEVQSVADGALGLWEVVQPYWPIALVGVGYLIWRGKNAQTRKRRVGDAQTGANDKR